MICDQIACSPTFQRDYFGAHTFRVMPGKENPRLLKDRDIRMYYVSICLHVSKHVTFRH